MCGVASRPCPRWKTSDRNCTPHPVCKVPSDLAAHTGGEFVSREGSAISARVCSVLAECDYNNEFEHKAPTRTSNRHCSALEFCTQGEYESTAKTLTSNRKCSGITKCTGTQWQTAAPSATSDRKCKECSTERACPWNQYRKGCGGTSPGECVYDCPANTNCFVGRGGTNWFDAKTQWSRHSFPTWPQRVQIAALANVRSGKFARGAAKKLVIAKGGNVHIRAKAALDVGTTKCSGNEWQEARATKTSDRACTLHEECSSTQWALREASATSARVCQDCGLCAGSLTRQQCGGASKGFCLPQQCTLSNVNCWIGAGGTRWLGSSTHWNKFTFPGGETNVVISGAEAQLEADAAASSVRVTGKGGRLNIKGGRLEITKSN